MNNNILFISDHGDPLAPLGSEQAGGQNNYVKQLALALQNEGNTVDVVTHWSNPLDPPIENFGHSCRVIRIGAGNRSFVPKNELYNLLPAFYEEMTTILPISTYDLIHTHYWLSGLLGSFLKAEYHIPWIHTNHSLGIAKESATGIAEPLRLYTEKMILSSADYIVATTKSEKSLINKFVENPSPVKIIPIGVDRAFRPFHLKKEEILHPYFAFAGRLQTTKGIYTLIDAFRLLVEKYDIHPTTKLVIAGGESNCVDFRNKLPKDNKLKAAIRGLEDRIDFLGAKSQKQLASIFNSATAVVVPSFYESFGMVAAEAQACGCPVIASKVGGLTDIVKNRVTGLHVEKGNENNLAQAMKTVISNKNYSKKLGKSAAVFANREFNWSILAKRMDSLYEVVIGERKSFRVGN
ncbi:glycosyltransferase [Psychrobacillus sp. NEAU-3TGS]|uniref:glycosyltransferase n=1 Tax=Psychrobacillus sp. NEAU-3TGS TaxID=2995412 RepID=UPI0024992874|nr:glycosyltransferase [Psychrobacillus sp. NEAU-3TGS]MDI2588281.1 glycosyltransferase [Psychrobacillus sp. NEAU-3TGS]